MMFVMCLIPFWVSETVRTLGWMILLRESGVLPAVEDRWPARNNTLSPNWRRTLLKP